MGTQKSEQQPGQKSGQPSGQQQPGQGGAPSTDEPHDSPPGEMTDRNAQGSSGSREGSQDDKARQAGKVKQAPEGERGSQSGKSDNPGTQPKH